MLFFFLFVLVCCLIEKADVVVAVGLDAGNEKKKELSKFEYNLNEMSEYSLANKLWAIIEENC